MCNEKTASDQTDQTIPKGLPLLDALVKGERGNQPLRGVTALLIQHQLGSMVPMTKAFIALGLRPERIYWIDIPYTANAEVRAALRRLGIPRENFAHRSYHLRRPYAPYQRKRVQQLYLRLLGQLQNTDRLLVLDDGSYFLEALCCHEDKGSFPQTYIVEQTMRGIIKMKEDATMRAYCARIPVVDVAQSPPKKDLESPEVGKCVWRSLKPSIVGEIGPKDNCLILGYGAIGSAVAAELKVSLGIPSRQIFVTDPDPKSLRCALEAELSEWTRTRDTAIRFNLVVGCSGTTSFKIGDRVFLEKGALLASASSGSAELSREDFIDLADTHLNDDIYVIEERPLSKQSIHDPINIHLGDDRTVRFLNGGFPVNFDGRVNCVPPQRIQVTHALQVGAALQALRTSKDAPRTRDGVIKLDLDFCDWVTNTYRELEHDD
jgi:S-adenosylhomocysteine hydrolase